MSKLSELIEIEKTYHLMERMIDGQVYWPFVRFRVFYDIIFYYLHDDEVSVRKPAINMGKCLASMLKKDAVIAAKKKNIMVYQDPVVYNSEMQCYECNITPPIIDELRDDMFLLSQIAGIHPDRKLRYPETAVVLLPLAQGKIKKVLYRVSKKEKRVKKNIRSEVDWLAELFKRERGVAIDKSKLVDEIYNVLCVQPYYYKYFVRVLERVKPKVIIEQCYYSLDKMVLNSVAKQKGIPTIELQHGIMGKDHPAYNCLCRNVDVFPEYVFLFSEFWKEGTQLPYDDEHIRITGSFNLELQLKKYNTSGTKNSILFVSEKNPELFKIALDLCRFMRDKKIADKKVLYKLHPGEDDYYDEYFEEGKEFDDILQIVRTTDKNLYECFAESFIQIGESSTGLFEGVAFELMTYIVDNPRVDTVVRPLIEKGYARVITSVNEITFDEVCTNLNIDFLWKRDALNNAVRAIKEIAGME